MFRLKLSAIFVGILVVSQTALAEHSRLDDMISPVSNPVNFEDPRNTTELRAIFLHHEIQNDFVTGGGDVQVYALQARLKLTDDFSLIATKDGYVDLNPNGVVPADDGFADISLGGKYTLFRNNESIVTSGLRYEIPVGDKKVLQGQEDGAINPFVSAAIALGDINLMAGSGLRIRMDSNDSSFWDLDFHADYKIGNFYPLVELNLVHVVNDGTRLPIADEGADFFNLGAASSAGKNILTAGVGARYRFCESIDGGVVYQFPLDRGEGSGIFDWRITADLIFRFDV